MKELSMSHDLFLAAKTAMAKAYAPYSKFPVGAALRCDDGRVFSGANIEVAPYPEGWCAETTALGHYIMGGGGKITEIAVIAERMPKVTPCGWLSTLVRQHGRSSINWVAVPSGSTRHSEPPSSGVVRDETYSVSVPGAKARPTGDSKVGLTRSAFPLASSA